MPRIAGKEVPYTNQPNFENQSPEVAASNELGQELPYIPLESVDSEFPISNAPDRMETYQLGGEVRAGDVSIGGGRKGGLGGTMEEGGKVKNKKKGYKK